MNRVLWIIQWILALLFLFAGGSKLVMPAAEMTKGTDLPGWFFRFIGVCEILGACGLILPGLLKIRQGLTPLAAAGLVIIMIGAVVVTIQTIGFAAAILPLVTGLLCSYIAYARSRKPATA